MGTSGGGPRREAPSGPPGRAGPAVNGGVPGGAVRVVRGEVVLPARGVPSEAAELVIAVEDVSGAAAPSPVIGVERRPAPPLAPGAALPFAIEVPEALIDERARYSVHVHLDVSGSGEIELGDLVSPRSHPVLTRGAGDTVRVDVRVV